MKRKCEACGAEFEARTARFRFCDQPGCRRRRDRLRKRGQVARPRPAAPGPLENVSRRELAAAGRLDTVPGQVALVLARIVEDEDETGSSAAAASKQLRAVMDEALKGVKLADDPLDELRARRDRRLRGGR